MSGSRLVFCVAILFCLPLTRAIVYSQTNADALPKGAVLRMGSTRLAHSTWLTSVQFSADDLWVGAADSSGVVRIWEVASGKLVWEKPTGTGRKLAFSPDGKTLAIGGYYSQVITLWDLQKDEALHELTQNARSLKFSKDGSMLAAAGRDQVARLWNPETGRLLKEFKGHEAELYAVAISPDGRVLASGGGQGGYSRHNEIRLWDIATGKQIGQLKDDNERLKSLPDAVYSLDFSANGKLLGSAGPYVARIWDVESRKLAHRLDKCSYDIAFSPLGKHAVTGGDFGIYDSQSGRQLVKLAGDVGVYGRMAYSHDGKLIASGNYEGFVQLWDARTGKELVRRSGHDGGVRSVCFSPDGSLAASMSRQDATIRVWGTTTGKQLLKIPVAWRGSDVWWNEEGSKVLFAPYGGEIMTWTYDSMVRYWRLGNLEKRSVQVGEASATAMAFSFDGTLAAVMEYSGGSRITIGVYELDGGTLVASLNPFEGKSSSDHWVSSMAFSPDGKTLAVGALGGSLRDKAAPSLHLWDLEQGNIQRRLRRAISPPGKVCFSPDGKLLATSSTRGTPLQIWRMPEATEVHALQVEADAHGRDPAPIAFSSDGKLLAAADANREIFVWEIATWKKIHTFRGHQKAVTSIAFSPAGKRLLSGSEDTTMLLWNVRGNEPVAEQLTAKQLESYWEALADGDAEIAAAASEVLLSAPQQALTLLKKLLTAGEVLDTDELPKLIADLRNDDANTHLRAAVKLQAFGIKASGALLKALSEEPRETVRRRIEGVLATIGEFPISAKELRRTRAVQLLEQIGSQEAAEILRRLADTKPPTAASLDADAAFQRLKRRLRAPKASVNARGPER